jgi:hypothetical protein
MLRKGDDRMHLRLIGNAPRDFFYGYVDAVHGAGLSNRLRGAWKALRGAAPLLKARRTRP